MTGRHSETEFGIGGGVNIGTERFFAGAGVAITTIEDSDPTFNVHVGLVLGEDG